MARHAAIAESLGKNEQMYAVFVRTPQMSVHDGESYETGKLNPWEFYGFASSTLELSKMQKGIKSNHGQFVLVFATMMPTEEALPNPPSFMETQ